MTPEQREQAKRGGLAAGTAAGLGTAAYGASLAGSGHTGIKNARYDIKNVRADRPANAKLRLKAAGNVIRHGGKLKRNGLLLGAAGALGAAAAGNQLHKRTAGSTLAKMPRQVQKSDDTGRRAAGGALVAGGTGATFYGGVTAGHGSKAASEAARKLSDHPVAPDLKPWHQIDRAKGLRNIGRGTLIAGGGLAATGGGAYLLARRKKQKIQKADDTKRKVGGALTAGGLGATLYGAHKIGVGAETEDYNRAQFSDSGSDRARHSSPDPAYSRKWLRHYKQNIHRGVKAQKVGGKVFLGGLAATTAGAIALGSKSRKKPVSKADEGISHKRKAGGGALVGTGLTTAALGGSVRGIASGIDRQHKPRFKIITGEKNRWTATPAERKNERRWLTHHRSYLTHAKELKRVSKPLIVGGAAATLGGAAVLGARKKKEPVAKGLTAGQMSILRRQGVDAIVVNKMYGIPLTNRFAIFNEKNAKQALGIKKKPKPVAKSLVNGKFVKATEAGSKALKRARGLNTEQTFTGKRPIPQGPANRYAKPGYKQRNAPTEGLVAGSDHRAWRGAEATSPRDYRNKVVAQRKAEESHSFENPAPREPRTYGPNPTSTNVGASPRTKAVLIGAGAGTAAVGTGAGIHHSRKKQVAKAVSPDDLRYLKETAPHMKRLSQMTSRQANTRMSRKNQGGFVVRQGGKNTGKSVVHVDRRQAGEPKQILTAHELAHAKPKRSEYRLHHQIAGSPYKMGREEGRADYLATGHYSENGGRQGHAPRARMDQEAEQTLQSKLGYMKPKPESKFHQGYFGTMDLLRDKGVKSRANRVTKSYTSTQTSILRRQGLDPISKANFFDFLHSGAGVAATGITIGDAKRKKRKRKKVEKADKRRDRSGAVITGAGTAAAGAGLVGGGIPGVKPVVPEGKGEGSRIKRARITTRSASGGIFGFRTEAHRNFLRGMEDKDKSYEGKPNSRADSFKRGLNAGKIGPEKEIIRHMRGGRIGSNVALVGGGAAAAYGVHRMRHPKNVSKAQKDTDRAFGTALGVGGTAAAGSVVGAHALEHQGRKWSERAASSLDDAGKIATKTGGHTSNGRSPNPRVKDVRPKVQPGKIARDPESFLRGHSSAKAHTVGALHGAAAQQRHFAGIYGVMGNNVRRITKPALGVAAVGGGGLLISRHRQKVNKTIHFDKEAMQAAYHRYQQYEGEHPKKMALSRGAEKVGIKYRPWEKHTKAAGNAVRARRAATVQKSLVNGKWLKSSQALHAYKQGNKVGGYGKAKGMTPQHKEIKQMTEDGAPWMKSVQQDPQKAHPTLGMLGLSGLAVRTGGKSSGKSTVLINPQSIARNSTGKRDYRRNKKMVLTHENAHAEPKRSQYRSHQLNASEGKMGREEGRADYLAQGHYSGYKSKIERSYLDNAPTPEFGAGYRSVQDKMHAAGTKVRKSFPVNHA